MKITKYIPLKIRVYIYQHLTSKIINYLQINKIKSYKKIPIIINNYNRLTFLDKLINSLKRRGYNNIYIIDNNSSYPPLLEYYEKSPYKVFRLKKNLGYKALWVSGLYENFKNNFYVYTDSDLEICEKCPDNFIEHFISIMRKYPFCQKVGFGIKIDDLPDYYTYKKDVLQHERIFWEHEIEPGIYRAMIDTTFAIYRPNCISTADPGMETYRTGKPYLIKHLPWYNNSSNLSEEELYYLNHIEQSTHWSSISK